MASVTITIPDVLVPRLREMMRSNFPQYSESTDAETFKKVTADYWKSMLASYEQQKILQQKQQEAAVLAQDAYNQAGVDGSGIG